MVNALRDGPGGVRIPVGARYFSLLQNVETGTGDHQASSSLETEALPRC